jgi:hypothetical protein
VLTSKNKIERQLSSDRHSKKVSKRRPTEPRALPCPVIIAGLLHEDSDELVLDYSTLRKVGPSKFELATQLFEQETSKLWPSLRLPVSALLNARKPVLELADRCLAQLQDKENAPQQRHFFALDHKESFGGQPLEAPAHKVSKQSTHTFTTKEDSSRESLLPQRSTQLLSGKDKDLRKLIRE